MKFSVAGVGVIILCVVVYAYTHKYEMCWELMHGKNCAQVNQRRMWVDKGKENE